MEENVSKINIERLCEALTNRKVSFVKINFDGSGDSGQVEYVNFYAADGDEISVDDLEFKYIKHANGEKTEYMRSATDFLEDVVYDILYDHYGGWEINDGSFGDVTFDATTGNMKIDFNERVVEINSSVMYLDMDGKEIKEED
jgi:hypothetical protein